MPLDPHDFMAKMEKRVCLTAEDKALLKSQAEWGSKIAPEMASHFYDYLGRDVEMQPVLNAGDGGRIHRLRETFI